MAVHHWPISNDSYSQQLLLIQRTASAEYAAYRAPPLGLDPTGEELAAAASSWAEEMLRGSRSNGRPGSYLLERLQINLRDHIGRVHNFSAAWLPPGRLCDQLLQPNAIQAKTLCI